MKNFAALLATIASVHAIQLEAQAEAEAEFGLGEFFSAGEMVPQFLGSGFFPTEDVAGFIESGDEEEDVEDDVTVVPDEDAEGDAEEDAEEEADEGEEKDPHGGANSAFASLANFDFDSLIGDSELPIDLEDDNFEQAFQKHDLTASVPLVGDFGDKTEDPSLSAVLGSVTEAVKLYEDDQDVSDDDSAESEDEVESGDDSYDEDAEEE